MLTFASMRLDHSIRQYTTVFVLLLFLLTVASCGMSEEKRRQISRAERARLAREDSLAFKIAVMPTLDCLPIFVAKEKNLFDTAKVDVRLRMFKAQMDCDTAIARGRVQGAVTDIVRGERLIGQGTPLRYVAATNAYWLLVGNKKQRVKDIGDLTDKMAAMTRFSATDMLLDKFLQEGKTKGTVFKVQINDVGIRLNMLINNEMDVVLVTEPQASQALIQKHNVLADSRKQDLRLGVIAFRSNELTDDNRSKQLQQFVKGYNIACDSINKYGIAHYSEILSKYCNVNDKVARAIPKTTFSHASEPRKKDLEAARIWLKK